MQVTPPSSCAALWVKRCGQPAAAERARSKLGRHAARQQAASSAATGHTLPTPLAACAHPLDLLAGVEAALKHGVRVAHVKPNKLLHNPLAHQVLPGRREGSAVRKGAQRAREGQPSGCAGHASAGRPAVTEHSSGLQPGFPPHHRQLDQRTLLQESGPSMTTLRTPSSLARSKMKRLDE